MVILVIEVIGYRHVLAADAPDIAILTHLPHQLLCGVVGLSQSLTNLLRTCRLALGTKRVDDLLAFFGGAILLRIPRDLPGSGGGVPRESKLFLLLYVPSRDVEEGVGPAAFSFEDEHAVDAPVSP